MMSLFSSLSISSSFLVFVFVLALNVDSSFTVNANTLSNEMSTLTLRSNTMQNDRMLQHMDKISEVDTITTDDSSGTTNSTVITDDSSGTTNSTVITDDSSGTTNSTIITNDSSGTTNSTVITDASSGTTNSTVITDASSGSTNSTTIIDSTLYAVMSDPETTETSLAKALSLSTLGEDDNLKLDALFGLSTASAASQDASLSTIEIESDGENGFVQHGTSLTSLPFASGAVESFITADTKLKCYKALDLTWAPTSLPTSLPTSAPTAPTGLPTALPTGLPTSLPTAAPTAPTGLPTAAPTAPTAIPTATPTRPTQFPTGLPTTRPTKFPTEKPTPHPTHFPTATPSGIPTSLPTELPTGHPTGHPTKSPTGLPTIHPTIVPTPVITLPPTPAPTPHPTSLPTPAPTSCDYVCRYTYYGYMKLEFNKLNHVHDLLDKVTMIRESPHQYLQLDSSLPLYNYNIELPVTKLIDNIDELTETTPIELEEEKKEDFISSSSSKPTTTSITTHSFAGDMGNITLSTASKISLATVFTLLATLLGVWLVKRRHDERRRNSNANDSEDDFIIVPGSRVTY